MMNILVGRTSGVSGRLVLALKQLFVLIKIFADIKPLTNSTCKLSNMVHNRTPSYHQELEVHKEAFLWPPGIGYTLKLSLNLAG